MKRVYDSDEYEVVLVIGERHVAVRVTGEDLDNASETSLGQGRLVLKAIDKALQREGLGRVVGAE